MLAMLDSNFDAMFDIRDGIPKVKIADAWYDFDEGLSNMEIPNCDNEDHGYGSGGKYPYLILINFFNSI